MTSKLSALVRRGTDYLTPSGSSANLPASYGDGSFTKARAGALFPTVDPAVDGEDCDYDCASCTVKYPAKFSIEEDDKLYGHVNGWATHLLVATGKTDWVRDVADEKGSVMEAVGKYGQQLKNGKLMLSATNMPVPDSDHDDLPAKDTATTVLLLPAFTIINNVTPNSVPTLMKSIIESSPTNTSPLTPPGRITPPETSGPSDPTPLETATSAAASTAETISNSIPPSIYNGLSSAMPSVSKSLPFTTRPCPHSALILMCSQRTRDARCGQSAPILYKEFSRILRPLGLHRDMNDERPGGVGIYFISHVGGHKYSANVMIYRRAGFGRRGVTEGSEGTGAIVTGGNTAGGEAAVDGAASQCIWLARVRPEDCEGIVKFTVLQGKVVKPERQLRGGFDREKGLVSW